MRCRPCRREDTRTRHETEAAARLEAGPVDGHGHSHSHPPLQWDVRQSTGRTTGCPRKMFITKNMDFMAFRVNLTFDFDFEFLIP